MNQHPIPQNISTYQFRLIGDMTIKQFLQIVVGLGIAIALYKTNLFFLFKWPLIFLSLISGFAAAFLPIQERPLDTWVNAFLKAIYAPTHFLWHKRHTLPGYFNFVAHSKVLTVDEMKALSELAVKKKRLGLTSYLQTLSESHPNALEKAETQKLSHYLSLFSPTPPLSSSGGPSPRAPKPPPSPSSLNIPASAPVAVKPAPAPDLPALPPLPKPDPPPPAVTAASSAATKGPKLVAVPVAQSTVVAPTSKPASPRPQALYPVDRRTHSTTLTSKKPSVGTAPVTDRTLPFPSAPTLPNTIVGMVLGRDGTLIENAIIEIRSGDGLPIRATKTNRLGQFVSATPLKNGTYELEVDSPGHTFAIIKLELKGQILAPLKIQAQN